MLVIGLGHFGTKLAEELTELGCEVMIIDRNENKVSAAADLVTASQIGDCCNDEVVRSLDVSSFDTCFVCIGDNFQSSLEITSLLSENGAKRIVCKASSEKQAKFLKIIGADEVILTTIDTARRTAIKYSTKNALDYIELTPEYAIFEIAVPHAWVGKSVIDIGVRAKYDVNIIGFKEGDKIVPLLDASRPFREGEHLMIAGSRKNPLV